MSLSCIPNNNFILLRLLITYENCVKVIKVNNTDKGQKGNIYLFVLKYKFYIKKITYIHQKTLHCYSVIITKLN